MKYGIVFLLLCICACGSPADHSQQLQTQVTNLQQLVDSGYKPRLGDFMTSIQIHHAKLWYAGSAGNWKLADFEIKSIQSTFDYVQRFCSDRPEVKQLPMILPIADSVSNAITRADPTAFKNNFTLLTSTCNNCHRSTKHEFNVIVVPTSPPFSNQDFKPAQ